MKEKNTSTFKERITKFHKEYLKIGQKKFEEECNMPNGTINNITNQLGPDNILKIRERYPELNIDWLQFNDGEMLKEGANKTETSYIQKRHEAKTASDLPDITGYYYPSVEASAGFDVDGFNDEIEKIPIIIPTWGNGLDFINVFGDSMYPKFNSGEIIGIKEVEKQFIMYGNAYVVVLTDGQVYLKYIKKGASKTHVLLCSENSFYEPKEVLLDDIKRVFIVKGVLTKVVM